MAQPGHGDGGVVGRQRNTVWSGSTRWAVTDSPRRSRRQNVSRQGGVAFRTRALGFQMWLRHLHPANPRAPFTSPGPSEILPHHPPPSVKSLFMSHLRAAMWSPCRRGNSIFSKPPSAGKSTCSDTTGITRGHTITGKPQPPYVPWVSRPMPPGRDSAPRVVTVQRLDAGAGGSDRVRDPAFWRRMMTRAGGQCVVSARGRSRVDTADAGPRPPRSAPAAATIAHAQLGIGHASGSGGVRTRPH